MPFPWNQKNHLPITFQYLIYYSKYEFKQHIHIIFIDQESVYVIKYDIIIIFFQRPRNWNRHINQRVWACNKITVILIINMFNNRSYTINIKNLVFDFFLFHNIFNILISPVECHITHLFIIWYLPKNSLQKIFISPVLHSQKCYIHILK